MIRQFRTVRLAENRYQRQHTDERGLWVWASETIFPSEAKADAQNRARAALWRNKPGNEAIIVGTVDYGNRD